MTRKTHKLTDTDVKNATEGNQVDILEETRSPMLASPVQPGYNRFKYYSALRTGYKQLNQKDSFLKVPMHVIDPQLFYI